MSKPLSTRISEARERLGFSQSAAAKEWGVSVRTLQGWESSDPKRKPRGFALARLEDILERAGVPKSD